MTTWGRCLLQILTWATTVSYAITAGNTGNAFDIDEETGEITVAMPP